MSDVHLRGFVPGPTLQDWSGSDGWQGMGDLIDSGFEPHTSRTKSERLTTRNIWPVHIYDSMFKLYTITHNNIAQLPVIPFCKFDK